MQTEMEFSREQRRFVEPQTILVATDLTDIGHLLPHAITQASASNAEIVLAHAIASVQPGQDQALVPSDGRIAKLDRDARLALESQARAVCSRGLRCSVAVRHGFPASVVLQLVRQSKAARVIVGTHGRKGLTRAVLGSVARELLDEVHVPVYAVGPHVEASPSLPRRILHPVSLYDGFEQSARVALEIARKWQAELYLLHVLNADNTAGLVLREASHVAQAGLANLARDAKPGAPVHILNRLGDTDAEILKAAEDARADLIILGEHVRKPWWKLQGYGRAYAIIASAPVPVLALNGTMARGQELFTADETCSFV
jgi:nucleotide-binding universal stress UspA family protein